MSLPTTYKPSPLSIGSPRTSPFRRADSPATTASYRRPESPSSTISRLDGADSTNNSRASTPTPPSPTKSYSQPSQQSHVQQQRTSSATVGLGLNGAGPGLSSAPTSPTKMNFAGPPSAGYRTPPRSPTMSATTPATAVRHMQTPSTSATTNAITSLPPQLLHQLRQTFSMLDRNSTGQVTQDDITHALSDLLGLPPSSTSASSSSYFPSSASRSMSLAQFLGMLSGPLSRMSRQDELQCAFEAFDEQDAGEIDMELLRDALSSHNDATTSRGNGDRFGSRELDKAVEGFTGRKVGKGEVFRYQEWLGSVTGSQALATST